MMASGRSFQEKHDPGLSEVALRDELAPGRVQFGERSEDEHRDMDREIAGERMTVAQVTAAGVETLVHWHMCLKYWGMWSNENPRKWRCNDLVAWCEAFALDAGAVAESADGTRRTRSSSSTTQGRRGSRHRRRCSDAAWQSPAPHGQRPRACFVSKPRR